MYNSFHSGWHKTHVFLKQPRPTVCSAEVCFYTYDTFYVPGPLSYRACKCVLIDGLNCRIPCSHLLLYTFRGQHKIIPQHSWSKSSTKPPSPFLTCQFKMATRPLLFSRHPIGHSEIHTLWALHGIFWPTKPVHGLVTTALPRLRQLKMSLSIC